MANFCEIAMIVLFGLSWPSNVLKTLRSRSTRGKSLAFLLLIDAGYVMGILGKLIGGSPKWYVLFFYILNFAMVTTDLSLYFFYRHRERLAAKSEQTARDA